MADRRRRRRNSSNTESENSEGEESTRGSSQEKPIKKSECESELTQGDETSEFSEYDSATEGGEEETEGDEDETTEEFDDDEDDVIIEDEGWIDEERQSGDGEEQPDKNQSLDDDEDKKNPAYIPRKGAFYEHDTRISEDIKEEPAPEEDDKKPKKKLWQEHESWNHDKFYDDQQAPKSRDEIIAIYGYDIRSHEKPPEMNFRGRKDRRRPDRSKQLQDYMSPLDGAGDSYQGDRRYNGSRGRGGDRGGGRGGRGGGFRYPTNENRDYNNRDNRGNSYTALKNTQNEDIINNRNTSNQGLNDSPSIHNIAPPRHWTNPNYKPGDDRNHGTDRQTDQQVPPIIKSNPPDVVPQAYLVEACMKESSLNSAKSTEPASNEPVRTKSRKPRERDSVDNNRGGDNNRYNRDNRDSGYNRDSRDTGYNRNNKDPRDMRYNRDGRDPRNSRDSRDGSQDNRGNNQYPKDNGQYPRDNNRDYNRDNNRDTYRDNRYNRNNTQTESNREDQRSFGRDQRGRTARFQTTESSNPVASAADSLQQMSLKDNRQPDTRHPTDLKQGVGRTGPESGSVPAKTGVRTSDPDALLSIYPPVTGNVTTTSAVTSDKSQKQLDLAQNKTKRYSSQRQRPLPEAGYTTEGNTATESMTPNKSTTMSTQARPPVAVSSGVKGYIPPQGYPQPQPQGVYRNTRPSNTQSPPQNRGGFPPPPVLQPPVPNRYPVSVSGHVQSPPHLRMTASTSVTTTVLNPTAPPVTTSQLALGQTLPRQPVPGHTMAPRQPHPGQPGPRQPHPGQPVLRQAQNVPRQPHPRQNIPRQVAPHPGQTVPHQVAPHPGQTVPRQAAPHPGQNMPRQVHPGQPMPLRQALPPRQHLPGQSIPHQTVPIQTLPGPSPVPTQPTQTIPVQPIAAQPIAGQPLLQGPFVAGTVVNYGPPGVQGHQGPPSHFQMTAPLPIQFSASQSQTPDPLQVPSQAFQAPTPEPIPLQPGIAADPIQIRGGTTYFSPEAHGTTYFNAPENPAFRSGITYFSPDQQYHPASINRRPKIAIPIVNPQDFNDFENQGEMREDYDYEDEDSNTPGLYVQQSSHVLHPDAPEFYSTTTPSFEDSSNSTTPQAELLAQEPGHQFQNNDIAVHEPDVGLSSDTNNGYKQGAPIQEGGIDIETIEQEALEVATTSNEVAERLSNPLNMQGGSDIGDRLTRDMNVSTDIPDTGQIDSDNQVTAHIDNSDNQITDYTDTCVISDDVIADTTEQTKESRHSPLEQHAENSENENPSCSDLQPQQPEDNQRLSEDICDHSERGGHETEDICDHSERGGHELEDICDHSERGGHESSEPLLPTIHTETSCYDDHTTNTEDIGPEQTEPEHQYTYSQKLEPEIDEDPASEGSTDMLSNTCQGDQITPEHKSESESSKISDLELETDNSVICGNSHESDHEENKDCGSGENVETMSCNVATSSEVCTNQSKDQIVTEVKFVYTEATGT